MTKHGHQHRVAVGVDGSDSALHAVRWAAEEAARRGAALRLVSAFDLPFRYPAGVVEVDSLRRLLRDEHRRQLDDAGAAAAAAVPGLQPELALADGIPVETLVQESNESSLLVLGTRGLGGFAGLLVGSTSVALAGRTHCPLVVVRGAVVAGPGDPVVVGVDGTPVGEAAIGFAFEQASARGSDLLAVHSWTDPAVLNALAGGTLMADYGMLEEQATAMLAERLAGWRERYPDVRVTRHVVREYPTRALLHFADGARLVVVGSRGRGGFAGLVLGSTSRHLLHHAPCPVAVVRTPKPEEKGLDHG